MKRSPLFLLPLLFSTTNALAWGERGHDAVTRVAARIVADSPDPETAAFGRLLHRKENMLGHLSNVPDIVWRNIGKDIDKVSSPSHYIDLEFILADDGKVPKLSDLPQDYKSYEKAVGKNCDKKRKSCSPGKDIGEKMEKAGHAPFRVEQLTTLMKDSFSEIKKLEKDGTVEQKTDKLDQALLYAGILSHFIGDLANPHHTTKNYDGWDNGQGGLHSYFETEIVDSMGLDLEAQVLDEASRHQPLKEAFAPYNGQFLKMAWALIAQSHDQLDELENLDAKYSLINKSEQGTRKKADRKAVQDVRERYKNFVILRLAAGADALARFWVDAWKSAGQPDLSFYKSYNYPVKPDFLPLTYMNAAEKH